MLGLATSQGAGPVEGLGEIPFLELPAGSCNLKSCLPALKQLKSELVF